MGKRKLREAEALSTTSPRSEISQSAKNAGIKKVIVPIDNQKDIEEISDEIKEGVEIIFVDTMEQVIKQAFIA